MNANDFSQINTSISVRERSFLSSDQLKQLLLAKDNEAIAFQLQSSNYNFQAEDLSNPDIIESKLMQSLASDYQFAYAESPNKDVIEIFGLKYLYHNLKCLLKERATGIDLSNLLLPIGQYSIEDQKYLASTLESSVMDSAVVEEVNDTWRDYQEYNDVKMIDLGLDYGYFHHLKEISSRLDDKAVSQLINALIDFYNVKATKRSVDQDKPNSFTYKVMSNSSDIQMEQVINHVKDNQLGSWFSPLNEIDFGHEFDEYLSKMSQGTITSFELEKLQDNYLQQLLNKSKLDVFGPMPILRYLFGKEMEVMNLRLILTGRINELSQDQLIERMKPVYGE